MALLNFVERLTAEGVRVGGLLQEAEYDAEGRVVGLNAIDVGSGRRVQISRPQPDDALCGLDLAALLEASAVLRAAIEDRVELMVVEKFGEQEQGGKGLSDEIMQTIAAGIPLLISVPAAALAAWQERSGGLGSVIEFDQAAFRRWWQQTRNERHDK